VVQLELEVHQLKAKTLKKGEAVFLLKDWFSFGTMSKKCG
jgi:hypothetical protein